MIQPVNLLIRDEVLVTVSIRAASELCALLIFEYICSEVNFDRSGQRTVIVLTPERKE